jgi:hypothetical protein
MPLYQLPLGFTSALLVLYTAKRGFPPRSCNPERGEVKMFDSRNTFEPLCIFDISSIYAYRI